MKEEERPRKGKRKERKRRHQAYRTAHTHTFSYLTCMPYGRRRTRKEGRRKAQKRKGRWKKKKEGRKTVSTMSSWLLDQWCDGGLVVAVKSDMESSSCYHHAMWRKGGRRGGTQWWAWAFMYTHMQLTSWAG